MSSKIMVDQKCKIQIYVYTGGNTGVRQNHPKMYPIINSK